MSLYSELGGEAAIGAALDRFYEKVLPDPQIGKYFEGVDMRRLRAHALAFLTMAFGGPNNYLGRDLRTAHERPRSMGLDERDAEVFFGHLRTTLEDLGVPDNKVEQVLAIAHGGTDDVLGR
jgi:hemoglobin